VDDNSRAFARNMFRLRVHESDGQAYEELFVKVMGYAHRGFRPVKAHGAIGDRKNDGFIKSSGTYFQVYAPNDIRKTQGDALKKLEEDFNGLKAFWHTLYEVKRFFFVINDKYRGVSPEIEALLAGIKDLHKLEEADVFLAKDLEEKLFGLSDDKIISIVGHVPQIEPEEFLLLSGFTYFLGAWIEFERELRQWIDPYAKWIVPREGLARLKNSSFVSAEEFHIIVGMQDKRNRLVHGDSNDLPKKAEIDLLVDVTERIRRRKDL
jgi:hypothetical protein